MTPDAEPVAERRVCSVLFCDVVGFTPLSESRDPEAVLGITFPAEALIAISGRDETSVRAALANLVRREVLSVSADPLSPERGSYQFAQDMLRQVAYDTLSRRDRKTRHLAVAAHLRQALPGDGEEVADVIARHYLDALHAVPGDPDTAGIRAQAITTLIRAAERAERAGAPARAATSYATAAELIISGAVAEISGSAAEQDAGALWVSAADAANAAAQPIDEARAIGARLRCQPLLDRADATEGAAEHAQHQIRA